ncbi:hypothetical protein K490DRAFT_69931 [Saccharata proteae CBS 121410]|uniref:Uncharacterized protein n=1 Tax=Saccharata proteae CBS 121410 TaxID=1314787 RepID=A0A9P4HPM5_9PEZI|nr:hypothetical protein K490DRAFT_69931 [Saccharata proteae CBS 121410]
MTRAKKHKPLSQGGLQFVTITDPAQARDRTLMRSVRSHVMTTYVQQEKNCVKKPGRNNKPRALRPTQDIASSSSSTCFEQEDARRDSGHEDVEVTASRTEELLHGRDKGYRPFALDGWAGGPSRIDSLSSCCDLGLEMDPFSTLPVTSVSPRSLTRLVKHCLSGNGVDTLSLKNDFISLVNQSVSKSAGAKVDNNTIMAAVRLLKMELAMQSREVLQKLEAGLRQMIHQSGGLEAFDKIATVIVGTVYMLAITQEVIPHPIYRSFLPWDNAALVLSTAVSRYSTWNARIDHRRIIVMKGTEKPIPSFTLESPIFCPNGSFHTLSRSPLCSSATLALLTDMLTLTELFLEHHADTTCGSSTTTTANTTCSPTTTTPSSQTPYTVLTTSLLSRLYSLPSASSPNTPVHRDWIYESIRLLSLVYATALHRCLPFSIAYAQTTDPQSPSPSPSVSSSTTSTSTSEPVSESENPKRSSSSSSSNSNSNSSQTRTPSLIATLVSTLYKTDPHEMWGEMAGVLFFLSLVGAAAGRSLSGNEQMHRRSLVWIAVQCTAVTTMGHSDAEMGILRRLCRVQEILGEG